MFKVGDRVVIAKASQYYDTSDHNPNDSVEGTITAIDSFYEVRWDNGKYNSYTENDLVPVALFSTEVELLRNLQRGDIFIASLSTGLFIKTGFKDDNNDLVMYIAGDDFCLYTHDTLDSSIEVVVVGNMDSAFSTLHSSILKSIDKD